MLRRNAWITLIPMGFLLVMTTWAMVTQLGRYYSGDQWMLFGLGAAVFVLELWLILEAVTVFRRLSSGRPPSGTRDPETVHYEEGVPDEPRA
jgi:carbon starvation protein